MTTSAAMSRIDIEALLHPASDVEAFIIDFVRSRPLPENLRDAVAYACIIIVVLILGILAAVVLPHVSYSSVTDAEVATLQSTTRIVKEQLTRNYAQYGGWPAAIDNDWFAGGDLDHPQNDMGEPEVQVFTASATTHPANKVLKAGVGGAYWYNPLNGSFRARVTDQGSAAATIDFYNRVNSSDETDLGNYGGGGGYL